MSSGERIGRADEVLIFATQICQRILLTSA
jgi:hypothetical protein